MAGIVEYSLLLRIALWIIYCYGNSSSSLQAQYSETAQLASGVQSTTPALQDLCTSARGGSIKTVKPAKKNDTTTQGSHDAEALGHGGGWDAPVMVSHAG